MEKDTQAVWRSCFLCIVYVLRIFTVPAGQREISLRIVWSNTWK